jgi:exodeoxyribonuclease-1
MEAFHGATWADRARMVETFDDDRLRELGRRLVYLEEPGVLDPRRRQQLDGWLKNRRHGREGISAGRTIADAMLGLDELEAESSWEPNAIGAIRTWLEGLAAT